MVNDVSGGQADPDMAAVVAAAGVPYVVMHWRGHSADMYGPAVYADVVAEVQAELDQRVHALVAAGVSQSQLILDPGLGFAKLPEHNWKLLASLDRVARLPGYPEPFPVLVAASGKGFLGKLLASPDGQARIVRTQRRRDDRGDRAGRRGRCVVRPGARGTRQPRRRGGDGAVAAGVHGGRSLMLDRISIVGLRVRGNHGVFASERESGQDFVVDAVLWLDTARPQPLTTSA